jgi:dTDP-4-dehydrorhamnose reductase
MRVLVTGSNGLLGQKLSDLLQRQIGVQLTATARSKSSIPLTNASFEILDICDPAAVQKIFDNVRPDVVIHCAAMTLVDKCELERESCWSANVTSVEHLINACRTYDSHLVHVSTDFVFSGEYGPLDETAIPSPVNFYGESKAEAERRVISSGISWCIVRTVLVYGVTSDMSRSNIVLWVKQSLENGKPIQVVNDQYRTPTLAEDLAMGCYLAATKRAQGIYHISGKDYMTPYDIAIKTAEFFNLDKSLITPVDSSTFKQPARRPLITGFIIDKAKKELGYEPHSFDEGLRVLTEQITHYGR